MTYFSTMCIRRGDLWSPAGEHSSPLPCSDNILMRTLLKARDFFANIYLCCASIQGISSGSL